MDLVHKPEARKWISRESIHLESYFEEFSRLVSRSASTHNPSNCYRNLTDELKVREEMRIKMKLMGAKKKISPELFHEIEEACDISQLDIENELVPMTQTLDGESANEAKKFECFPIPEEGIKTLKTLQNQQNWLEKASKEEKYKRNKFCRYPSAQWFECLPKRADRVNTTLIDTEIVLTVKVYRPFKPMARPINTSNTLKFNQELLVLGTNKLSDLRDHIVCNADYFLPGDVSKEPFKQRKPVRCKDIYKSGFFFIENCFYNDMRFEENIDYSETIRKWASSKHRGIGEFTTAKMEEVQFKDLSIRLGYPYVYVHQGSHEHLLIFTEVKLHSADDPQKTNEYPFERTVGARHSKYCMVCSINVAKWVTKDNERVPEDPFLWCQVCFKSFNYDNNDQPIGKFRAFPYVDANAL